MITTQEGTRKSDFFPWALFFTAFLLYLSLIGKGSYHPDTLSLLDQVERTLQTGHLQPWLTGYNIPVLAGAMCLGVAEWVGFYDRIVALNFISVLFAAMAVPVFYLFCRLLWGHGTAFFSSVLMMTFPMFFSLATFANSQAPAMFFLFLGLLFLARFREGRLIDGWGAVIAFGFLGASRPQELFLMIIPASILLCYSFQRSHQGFLASWWQICICFWGMAILIALAIPLPFLSYHGAEPVWEQIKGLYQIFPMETTTDLQHVMPMFLWGMFALMDSLYPLVVFSSIGGLFLLIRDSRRDFYFLLSWFFVGFIFYAALFHKLAPTGRYLLFACIPLIVSVGYVISRLCSCQQKLLRNTGFFLFIFIVILFMCRALPPLVTRHVHAINNDFAAWVSSVTEPNALIFCRGEQPFVGWHGHRRAKNLPYILVDGQTPSVASDLFSKDKGLSQWLEQGNQWLSQKLHRAEPVYILIPRGVIDDQDVFVRYLQQKYRFDLVGEGNFEWWAQSLTDLQVFEDKLYRISLR